MAQHNFDFIIFDWKGTLEAKHGEKVAHENAGLDGIVEHLQGGESLAEMLKKSFAEEREYVKKLEKESGETLSKNAMVERVLKKCNVDPVKYENAVAAFWEKYNIPLSEKKRSMYPGAEELLQRIIKAGIPIALVRNTTLPGPVFNKTLVECQADKYFTLERNVVLSGEVGFAKPHPAVFEAVLKKCDKWSLHRSNPTRILYIGNETEADVTGGNKMGWKTVLIRTTEKSSGGLATYEVDNYQQLEDIIFGCTES